jgi:ATP-dependent Clp protease, protease subunit
MKIEEPENPLDATAGYVRRVEEDLLRQRKVLIFGEVNERLARDVSSRLLLLIDEGSTPIDIYINSPGGHVESGDTIHDIIRFVRNDLRVNMIGTGMVASAGAHIFLAGAKDRRFCLPNTRFLLHQPMGGARGTASDMDIEATEILRVRDRLMRIVSEETGQPIERVIEETRRNHWMTAEEAVDYGMVAKIIRDPKDLAQETLADTARQ